MGNESSTAVERLVRLLGERKRRLQIAAGAGLVLLLLLLLPASESFSSDGFTSYGGVEISCGSLLNRGIDAKFDDVEEQFLWDNYAEGQIDPVRPEDDLYIFEGQSATSVCDETLSSKRNYALLAGFVALLMLASLKVGQPGTNS